jgi:threonine dehydratase
VALRTPLVIDPRSDENEKLYLKAECLQPIGSFKLRGAYNKVCSLTEEERKRGIIAHSSGNHAQGAAFAARAMGVKATIVIPETAPKLKIENTRALGATVILCGPTSVERVQMAEDLAAKHGYIPVPPYNDEKIIAGTGTIGMEILEDMADVDLVLAPVSGGGLISGIAAAIKLSNPKIKVIGVEPELAADAQASLRAGERVTWDAVAITHTIADGLRTSPVGEIPWQHMKTYVDDIVTVTEDEIRKSVRRILQNTRLLAEPSGAVAPAAFFFHREQLPVAKKTVAVVSGGNIAPEMLLEILASE